VLGGDLGEWPHRIRDITGLQLDQYSHR
jgi:hypothetical protein